MSVQSKIGPFEGPMVFQRTVPLGNGVFLTQTSELLTCASFLTQIYCHELPIIELKRVGAYHKLSHLTVVKTSAVGISYGKPSMILVARQLCLSIDLYNCLFCFFILPVLEKTKEMSTRTRLYKR